MNKSLSSVIPKLIWTKVKDSSSMEIAIFYVKMFYNRSFQLCRAIKKGEIDYLKILKTEPDVKLSTVSDKYKHMEESPFKRIFLRSITGNLTENVDNALQMKSVSLYNEITKY